MEKEKQFSKPEIEIITFGYEDVILTSNSLGEGNIEDVEEL